MANPDSLIGQHIGQFRLDEFIARGASCLVYKAYDTVLVRTVALKLISKKGEHGLSSEELIRRDEARKRLMQEAKAAGRLSHSNIVTIHAYGQTEDFEYICMEYVHGRTLDQILGERRVLSTAEAVEIFGQVLLALDAANREQIVHRDIKPSNIMITDAGVVKVMDFGIAKLPSFSMTTTGTVLGTPYYMSPEQITGQEVDIRSDLFSLGAVLYQALTGERPFEATNTATLAYKIVQVEPIPPDVINIHIPRPLGNILRKALAKNPADRFQTPAEMLRSLVAVKPPEPSTQGEDVRAPFFPGVTAGGDLSGRSEVRMFQGNMASKAPAEFRSGQSACRRLSGEDSNEVEEPTADSNGEVFSIQGTAAAPIVGEDQESKERDSSRKKLEFGQEENLQLVFDPAAGRILKPPISYAPLAKRRSEGQSKILSFRVLGFLLLIVLIGGAAVWLKNAREPGEKPPAGSGSIKQEARIQPPTNATGEPSSEAGKQVEAWVREASGELVGNPSKAQVLLRNALAEDPHNFEALFLLGKTLSVKKDYHGAIEQYQQALRVNGQSADVYFNLGHAYQAVDDYDAAIVSYESCLALKPPYQDEVLTYLGISYLKKNDPGKARSLFGQALELNPDSAIARRYMASAGPLPSSEQSTSPSPKTKPQEPSIAGPAQVHAPLQEDAALSPAVKGSVDALVAQAKMLFDTNPENAQKLLEEAIVQDPRHFDAVFQLGRLLTFRKDYNRAIECYEQALKINNQAPDVFFNLGYIFMILKDYDSAIVNYEACRSLSPPYQDEVLTNLGISYLKKNNPGQAKSLFQQAMELNAKNNIARNYLKNLERSRKDMDDPASSKGRQSMEGASADQPERNHAGQTDGL